MHMGLRVRHCRADLGCGRDGSSAFAMQCKRTLL